jgi:hypothetical protein
VPKKLPLNLADQLETEISKHSAGISPTTLFSKFEKSASTRSLARIVKRLESRGRIFIKGNGPATRYLPAPSVRGEIAFTEADDTMRATGEVYVPMSGESGMLREWVRRPITLRRPVGYDRQLLDAYRPNTTFYLSDAPWRERMQEIGRAPTTVGVAGTYGRDILNRLLIDLSWASSHLEGNTYSRLDTQNLIEQGREADGKDRLETQMILNHKEAIEFLVDHAAEVGMDNYTFRNLHALLSQNLLGDPNDEGRLRSRIVEIGGTVYRPLQVPQQIEELFQLMLEKAGAITDPFEQAFFLMVHVPYLQPFVDVNKRVSRLAANISLIKGNLCPLSFVDVPTRAYVEGTLAIYEHARVDLLRDVFIWAYERSCDQFKAIAGSLPDPDPFRLKYRNELIEAVGELVRAGTPTTVGAMRQSAAGLVPPVDQKPFFKLLRDELGRLNEGNVARYRLRLQEYLTWKAKQARLN